MRLYPAQLSSAECSAGRLALLVFDVGQGQVGQAQIHEEEERQVADVVRGNGTVQAKVLEHGGTVLGPSGGLALELVDLRRCVQGGGQR